MDKASKNVRYKYTKEPSGAFVQLQEWTSADETSLSQMNVSTEIKASASPHFTKVVIALVVAGVVAVGGIAALVIVLTSEGEKGDTTTPVAPATSSQAATSVSSQATVSSALSKQTTGVTQPDSGESTWSPWGEWTQCTATCDSGIHKRYRKCNGQDSTECVGDFVETEVCVETTCLVYGKWTTWGSWGSCDVTCGGGTQSRARTCSKTDPSDLECVGSNSQDKICSDWECPDCYRACIVGVLNTHCDICVCSGTVITGRVSAISTGNPVSNAALYASTAPTKLLSRSNSTGFFTLDDMCTTTELIVSRDGFVDKTAVVGSDYVEINMTKLVLPYLTETPQTKYRLSGEDVTFCCETVANPAIDYYEWLKDDIILDETLFQDGKLTLSDLAATDSGRYQCRANSPAGAIMSSDATLLVKNKPGEFCTDALQQKTVALPDDCVQTTTNTATYEVGECISKRCRENTTTDSGTCREDIASCCKIGEADLETVQCSGYELELIIVRSCSCAADTSNSVTISGTAVGVDDGSPLKFGEVWVNGVFTTYTSSSGDFSYIVSKASSKVTMHLQDNYFRLFLPAVKVIEITDEMRGVLRVNIRMIQAVKPITIDSATENTLVAGASGANRTTPVVQISIPANAFYYTDGTQYFGTVEASLTFLDPTNSSVIDSIPGTFSFVNEEGQTGNLASLGVFNLYFEDTSGNPLVLDEVVDLYVPLELGEEVTDQDIKLWRMNTETGIWEYVISGTGFRRRKRQLSSRWIGEIDWSTVSDSDWWNYDMVYDLTDKPCYFKIRLFKDKALVEPVPNPERIIDVEYHIFKDSTLTTISGYLYHPDYQCTIGICEDDNAYVSLYYYGRTGYESLYAGKPETGTSNHYFEIMDDDKVLKIEMTASASGPFYEDEMQCIVSTSNDYHLRYHYGKTSDVFTYSRTFSPPQCYSRVCIDNQIRISQRTWYPKRSPEGYRVCFIKVRLLFELGSYLSPGQFIKLRATSYGGTNTEITDFVLGIREYDIESLTENSTICVEYKCSGIIDPHYDEQFDYTRVVLTLIYPKSDIASIVTEEADFVLSDPTVNNDAQIGSEDGTYEIYAPTVYTPDIGLYSATSDNLEIDSATNTALSECRSGEPQNLDDENPNIGVAITFTLRRN